VSASPSLTGRVGRLALPLAVPCLFLHATYQPHVSLGVGTTSVDVTLADVAIAVVVLAALARARRDAAERLWEGRWLLVWAAALVSLVLVSLAFPRIQGEPYEVGRHLISALKFGWYALLAPSALLLVRSTDEVRPLLRSIVLWSGAATAVGLLQFVGLVSEFEGKRPGQREPSFVGIHDFAALSGCTLVLGLGLLCAKDERLLGGRRWMYAATAAGGLGVVLSGAMTGAAGVWLALATGLLLFRLRDRLAVRRMVAVAAIALVVTAGTALMRATAIERFAEFLGLRERGDQTGVESYAHRTLLLYLGGRIWLDHPVLGVGWQGSYEEWAFAPYLDDAHARFPNEPEEAFPASDPARRWGVQNLYLQALADLGVVGAALVIGLFAVAASAAVRRARDSRVPIVALSFLLVAACVWAGIGLIPGIPLAALTWIALGLVHVRE
jgi:O-antigen ligase